MTVRSEATKPEVNQSGTLTYFFVIIHEVLVTQRKAGTFRTLLVFRLMPMSKNLVKEITP